MQAPTVNERMDRFIWDRWPSGDFVSSVFAEDLVEELRRDEPELLREWLDANAVLILTDLVTRKSRRIGPWKRAHEPRQVFDEAAREFERTGDPEPLRKFSAFDEMHAVDVENTRKRIGDMVGADLRFVSGTYAEAANQSKLLSVFYDKLAEKAGVQRVEDVMDEATFLRLKASITGGAV